MSADVTIVVPTRNRPVMLARALDSIARQTLTDYEVCVVDDGSDEHHAAATRALIEQRDARFRLLQPLKAGETGSGPSASRNRGIRAGHSRYVAFLDDDDFWTWDGYLSAAVEALDRTGADLHCVDMQGFLNDTIELHSWFSDVGRLVSGPAVHANPPAYQVARAAFLRAVRERPLHPNMSVIRRSLIERVGGFRENLRFAEDAEFGLRLADAASGIIFCPRVAVHYQMSQSDSHSATVSLVEQDLQTLMAAHYVRTTALTEEGRRAGRDLESWTLRQLGDRARREGRAGSSVRLALQALVVYPSLGALLHLMKAATHLPISVLRTRQVASKAIRGNQPSGGLERA